MTEEQRILKDVCQRLERAAIPYMITGSIAANFYAVPRMTRDIDIVIEIQKEHAAVLLDLFQDDFYVDRDSVSEAIEKKGMFNIIHLTDVLKVDFIVRKNSPYRKIEFERRCPLTLEGVVIWVVSPEDLIISKLYWAKDSLSELQLGDVKNLLGTLSDLDMAYIERWCHSLGLDKIYQQVKS